MSPKACEHARINSFAGMCVTRGTPGVPPGCGPGAARARARGLRAPRRPGGGGCARERALARAYAAPHSFVKQRPCVCTPTDAACM